MPVCSWYCYKRASVSSHLYLLFHAPKSKWIYLGYIFFFNFIIIIIIIILIYVYSEVYIYIYMYSEQARACVRASIHLIFVAVVDASTGLTHLTDG